MFEKSHFEVLKWFQLNYPELVQEMKDSSHHFSPEHLNPWHMESDVWSHTMMVFKNSETFCQENHVIKWSTLLHDIGKPGAREEVPVKQRVRFVGHCGLSAFMAIDILNKAKVHRMDAEMVFKIIAVHDSLFKVINEDGVINAEAVKKQFVYEDILLENLVEQVRADSLGRFHSDGNGAYRDTINNLPQRFKPITDNVIGEFDVFDEGEDDRPRLVILVGPPCSGKSTWIDHRASDDTVVLSRDDILVEAGEKRGFDNYTDSFKFFQRNRKAARNEVDNVLNQRANEARKVEKTVVIDMTNMTKKGRRRWINQFPKYHKTAVMFATGYEEIKRRNIIRSKEEGKFIPVNVLKRMCMNFTLPMHSEGFDTIGWQWAD